MGPGTGFRTVIGEMVRVAGPEGQVLFIDYCPGPLSFPQGWFYKSVIYAIEFGAGWEHFQNHRRINEIIKGQLGSTVAAELQAIEDRLDLLTRL